MRRIFCFVFCLGTSFFLPAQAIELPRSIVLVADEWAPYNMVPQGEQEGYIVDVVREVFAISGISVDYQIVPWARAVLDTRKGAYDGVIGASIADAPGFVFPTEMLAINRLGFFTLPSSPWVFTGEKSLAKVSLGVIKGYDYRAWLSAYIEQNKDSVARIQIVVGDRPLETNIRKLLAGKVGAIVDSQTAIQYTAKSMNLETPLRLAGTDNEPAYIHVAFSPAKPYSTSLANLLSKGITDLRRTGRLAAILARYGLTDWKP